MKTRGNIKGKGEIQGKIKEKHQVEPIGPHLPTFNDEESSDLYITADENDNIGDNGHDNDENSDGVVLDIDGVMWWVGPCQAWGG